MTDIRETLRRQLKSLPFDEGLIEILTSAVKFGNDDQVRSVSARLDAALAAVPGALAEFRKASSAFGRTSKPAGFPNEQNSQLSSTDRPVYKSAREDLAALVKANESSYRGLQALVARQTQMLRSSIAEWEGAFDTKPGKNPLNNLAKLDEMGRVAFKRALDDIRELSDLAAKSQSEAFEIVRKRINENVDQVSKQLSRGK